MLELGTKRSENPEERKCVAPELENFTEGWCHFPLQKEGYLGRGVSARKTTRLRVRALEGESQCGWGAKDMG